MSRVLGRGAVAAANRQADAASGTYRRIWELAWPVSISTSTFTLLTLANLYWIGHLGTLAVAAVSLSSNVLFNVFAISHIVYIGSLATVARRVGAGEYDEAFNAGLHGVCLGAVLGLTVAVVGYASAPPIVRFFDAGADLESAAIS
jgi:Na+-driven multidrug efflux pump